jgi:hypothetical protein
MGASRSWQGIGCITGLLMLIVGSTGTMTPMVLVRSAAAQDIQTAIEKANLYIEVAKLTERAVDSWERYASWVNILGALCELGEHEDRTDRQGALHLLRHV